jgi:hypothetical protein
MRAGCEWLRSHGEGLIHAGKWEAGREQGRASLVFYQAQALAAVLAGMEPVPDWAVDALHALRLELPSSQSSDGSWQGAAPDSCEDEPLLATAFALRALTC